MTAYGVAGPVSITEAQAKYVRKIVHRAVLGVHRRKNTLASGVAFGADTEALIAVWGLIPFKNMLLCVPGTCNHNRTIVEKAKAVGAQEFIVPNQHTVSATYMARNDLTITKLDILLAFPMTNEEEVRSGTWATIRRARKAGKKVRYYPLENA